MRDKPVEELRRDRRLQPTLELELDFLMSEHEELDKFLGGGFCLGTATEFVGSFAANTFALWLAASTTRQGLWVGWIDPLDCFDPLSFASMGGVEDNLLWMRVGGKEPFLKSLTCVDHLLSSGGFSLVVVDFLALRRDKVLANRYWQRFLRRLRQSKTLLVLLLARKPARSSVDFRLLCHKKEGFLGLSIDKSRSGREGQSILLELAETVDGL